MASRVFIRTQYLLLNAKWPYYHGFNISWWLKLEFHSALLNRDQGESTGMAVWTLKKYGKYLFNWKADFSGRKADFSGQKVGFFSWRGSFLHPYFVLGFGPSSSMIRPKGSAALHEEKVKKWLLANEQNFENGPSSTEVFVGFESRDGDEVQRSHESARDLSD